ncbi:hypothetical protein [Thermus caldifontis]|uniref:hypothetical protein n=1 Tax=Thermus caldifontis TaxID=1930763 RepID=UPI001F07D387|nr:hypothetical protein [Thermus caldifontis]
MVISWLRVPGNEELSPEVRELFARFQEKMGFVPNVARATIDLKRTYTNEFVDRVPKR